MSMIKIALVEPGKQEHVIEELVHSEEELLDRLRALKTKYLRRLDKPIGVDLISEQGDYLSIGLGVDESVVIYFPADGTVYYSLGDESAQGTTVCYFCQWTELTRKYVIPWKKAEAVARDWLRTGLSDEIRWTDEML